MEAALLALVGVLVTQLLVAHYKSQERRSTQIRALADFLEKTAECLEEMREKLASYEIPTGTGTRVKTHIRQYEEVLGQAALNPKEQAALRTAIGEIRKCLLEGQAEDEILRGSALRYAESDRLKLLDDLKRTAWRLKGEAESLRAKVV